MNRANRCSWLIVLAVCVPEALAQPVPRRGVEPQAAVPVQPQPNALAQPQAAVPVQPQQNPFAQAQAGVFPQPQPDLFAQPGPFLTEDPQQGYGYNVPGSPFRRNLRDWWKWEYPSVGVGTPVTPSRIGQFAGLGEVPTWAYGGDTGKPFANYTAPAAVSPYINLFNRNSGVIDNYNLYVLPALEQEAFRQQTTANFQHMAENMPVPPRPNDAAMALQNQVIRSAADFQYWQTRGAPQNAQQRAPARYMSSMGNYPTW